MKKLLVWMMVFALVLSMAACGAQPAEQPAAPAEAPPAAPVQEAPAAPAEAPAAPEAPAEEPGDFPEVSLTFSSCFAANHSTSVLDQAWLDRLAAEANIKTTTFWSSALLSAATPYEELCAGVADIGHISTGTQVDHFVLENAIQSFWWGCNDSQVAYECAREMYEQTPEWQAEYAGTKPVYFGSVGTYWILSTEPVYTLEDIAGKTFRSTSSITYKIIEELGGSSVRMSLSEMYEGLEKGIIDGCILPAETLETNNLADYVGYATCFEISGPYCVLKLISDSAYDKLTGDQQEYFMSSVREREQEQINAVSQWAESALNYGEENGVEIIYLSEEDAATVVGLAEQIAMENVDALTAAGYDGAAIYERARSILESKG